MKNKILHLTLAICLIFFTLTVTAYAEPSVNQANTEQIQKVVDSFFQSYFDSIVNKITMDTSDIVADTDQTYLFQRFIDWRVAMAKALDVGYKNYSYNVAYKDISTANGVVTVKASLDANYEYEIESVGEGSCKDIIYDFELLNTENGYVITSISTDDDMYTGFLKNINVTASPRSPFSLELKSSLETRVRNAINDLYNLAEEMKAIEGSRNMSVEEGTSPETDAIPAATYSYTASTGVEYANKYVENAASFFYNAGVDCTNFVSQCIWAAYGGWNSSQSNSTIKTNISNKVRMVNGTYSAGWFAGPGGGSGPWESVNSLWSFATGSPSKGPKATGSNNGSLYTGVSPSSIAKGNVLQFGNNSSTNYGHSVYVITVPSSPTYSKIKIAQHTSNAIRTLSEVISTNGAGKCYMRKMSFSSATFDS
ncbi:amidase domain-containing protein [Desulfoscipio sp. XC116]|uniref:amidase domain-containing protein n=1 Tax=Desulfoscipio sp. XC116 TaxID=3144975 RepID=UPI00325AF566